jgi:hypothetical protein
LSLREVRRVAGASSAENEAEDLCFEFQADSLATQLLFLSGLADDWAQSAPIGIRYVNRLKVYGATGASFFLDPARRLSRFRALLLAACVACLLFEVTRKNLRGSVVSHPTPSARLINVCATALSSYGDIAQYAAGTYSDEVEYPLDVLRPAITEMMMVMADLQLISAIVDLDDTDYRAGITASTTGKGLPPEVPIARDVFRVLTHDSASYETQGGRQFKRLNVMNDALWARLEPFGRMRNWR